MKKHHISPWIALFVLLFSMTAMSCAELSPPSAEGLPCGSSTECAGLVCDPNTLTCKTPIEDLDTDFPHDNNNPKDDSGNPTDTNPTDTNNHNNNNPNNPNPTTTFSGCTDNTQCAGYQTCNVARGRCEDTRKSCTSSETCETGQHCNANVCTTQCNETMDCAEGLACLDTGSIKLCVTTCHDFSTANADCAPDTHCIPYFGSEGGICKGTGRKKQAENCLNDGDPDSCRPGHSCLSLGKQRTCQKLCAPEGTPGCSADTYCEPAFFGPDDNTSTDDAGICLNDCNPNGQPDNTNCPPEHTCLSSTNTDKSFCVADDGGGLDAPCDFSDGAGCAIGLTCLSAGHGAAIGTPEVGVCTNICNPTQSPTGCANGYACMLLSNSTSPEDGACMKTCDPHKPAATNGCPLGRERCMPETNGTVPAAAGLCQTSGNTSHGEVCSTDHFMSCSGDDICATMTQTQGQPDGQSEAICTTFCPAFDYTNPSRCPAEQVCGTMLHSDKIGFCTTFRTTNGQNTADRCDASTENQGKWCNDNILCDYWNGQFLSCEIPCATDLPNICPTGQSCGSINNAGSPNFGYCR